jgi:hypothetical protein
LPITSPTTFAHFPMLGVGRQVLLPHRVEDAALDRLQPVAHIRQRAGRDDGQCVVEVARLRGVVQRHHLRAGRRRRCGGFRIK